MFGTKLALFPLSVCSPCSGHWHLQHRAEQCCSKRGWSVYSALFRVQAGVVPAPVRILVHSPSAASISARNDCCHPIKMSQLYPL